MVLRMIYMQPNDIYDEKKNDMYNQMVPGK